MEIFCVKDLLFSKTKEELEWFFVKLKTIVLVIIIKPYMVFVFSDFDVKRKPNKTMKG